MSGLQGTELESRAVNTIGGGAGVSHGEWGSAWGGVWEMEGGNLLNKGPNYLTEEPECHQGMEGKVGEGT